ncbi:DUF309 domain-containing protein, partial [Streptomyces sp. SID14478]|nr:DUF309 domain-containing protein [Streptomyces sp. SID14478]
LEAWRGRAPGNLDTGAVVTWARALAARVERTAAPVDAATSAPRLTRAS